MTLSVILGFLISLCALPQLHMKWDNVWEMQIDSNDLYDVQMTRDDNILVLSLANPLRVHLINTITGELVSECVYPENEADYFNAYPSFDGQYVLTVDNGNGRLSLWNTRTDEFIEALIGDSNFIFNQIKWANTSNYVSIIISNVQTRKSWLEVWDIARLEHIYTWQGYPKIGVFSPEDNILTIGEFITGKVIILNLEDLQNSIVDYDIEFPITDTQSISVTGISFLDNSKLSFTIGHIEGYYTYVYMLEN